MNEFKIKTGLILGVSPTQPVNSITDSSSFETDASSTLATVKAIRGFVETTVTPINASISRIDASLNDQIDATSLFVATASIGYGFAWNAGMLDVSVLGGGSALSNLSDVSINNPQIGQMLMFDPSGNTGLWQNITPTEASLYFWELSVPLLKESSIGSGLLWNAGMLDVSVIAGGSDASIAELFNWNLSQDASIVRIDASINDTIEGLEVFFPNASIGTGLEWNAGYLTVPLDSSITKIGDQTTDGSWRFIIDSSGNLSIQKRVSGSWVEKGNFN